MFGSIRRLLSRWRLRIATIRLARKLKRQVIVHEAGHGLAAWLLPAFRHVLMVSAVPAGPYRGFTVTAGPEGEWSADEAFQGMTMSMAGIAAEGLLIGEISDGGQDDIHGVLAAWLLYGHGLSASAANGVATALMEDLYGDDPLRRANAEAFASPVLTTFYIAACELLRPRLKDLRRVAKALRRKKYLEHPDFERILGPRICIDLEPIFGTTDDQP